VARPIHHREAHPSLPIPPLNSGKTYEERLKAVSPISKPLAGKKLTKKLYKLVKKASGAKYVKRGVKEVVKVRQNLFGQKRRRRAQSIPIPWSPSRTHSFSLRPILSYDRA